jgi:hypothetical protein
MKVAQFTVQATAQQSARWKQAAEGEGYTSVGVWLAGAADAYLKARARAGMPIPLAWRAGRFRVVLFNGESIEVSGVVSPPFGAFRGTEAGPVSRGRARHTLVYIPTGRIVATLFYRAQVKTLGACAPESAGARRSPCWRGAQGF